MGSLRRLARLFGTGVGVLGTVALIWVAIAAIAYSPTYVGRLLTMRESSQQDYLDGFATRPLHPSWSPSSYVPADPADGAAARRRIANAFGVSDLDEFLATTSTQALLVIENDELLVEDYANGADRATMVTSFSVAKSFDSTLVGIAIDEGFIGSVNDPIIDYLPELAKRATDPRVAEITIADLMSMSSGLEYREMRWALFNGDDPLTTYHPDQRKVSVEAATRVVEEPGTYFSYNKYHPQLLGMILERATGMTVTEFTQTRLWDPLGMQYLGEWTLDSEDHGFEKMEAGLNARAIDFAKLGSLFLHLGEWNGDRVVSTSWVRQSIRSTAERRNPDRYRDDFGDFVYDDGNGWYGYFWYARERPGSRPDFFAEGDHGQFIFVCPAGRTVIVRNGTEWGLDSADWIDAFTAYCDATIASR